MLSSHILSDDLAIESNNILERVTNRLEISESSSDDTESEISLSEKIVLESNEKRLRKRMTSLQESIMNLKEQLKLEKELWKEDIEKIKELQKQQQEMKCTCYFYQSRCRDICGLEDPSRCSSIFSLTGCESNQNYYTPKSGDNNSKVQSIKQLLDLQNYKRKLAETENMCNMELYKVKQSLQDLKTLQNIAHEWGKDENDNIIEYCHNKVNETDNNVEEIFMSSNNNVISNH